MEEVYINSSITYLDETINFDGKGKYSREKNILEYHKDDEVMTYLINESILVRDTKDSIFSYKLEKMIYIL